MSVNSLITIQSTYSRTGEIVGMELTSSSGNKEFDSIAFDAIKSASPLTELTLLNQKDFEEASVINFTFEGIKKIE